MTITLKSPASKMAAVILISLGFLAPILWVAKTALASMVSEHPTVQSLQLAAQLDPTNAEYALYLGRQLQYNVADIDSSRAAAELLHAIELNPFEPQAWLDLSRNLDLQGKTAEAEVALRGSDYMAPHLPGFQWSIANTFLLHGGTDEAFRHFKAVLMAAPDYGAQIFRIAWKAAANPQQVLNEVLPDSPSVQLDYLNFLLAQRHEDATDSVWKRVEATPGSFPVTKVSPYFDYLLGKHRLDDASRVWADLVRRGLVPSTDQANEANMVLDGDFEEPVLNLGFQWRFSNVDGVQVSIDNTTFRSPGHSLRVEFEGKSNLDYHDFHQLVRVQPGHRYRLTWFMKTDDITTDSGVRAGVRDAYNLHALDQDSESVTGTTAWSPYSMDFTTGPKTDLVVLSLPVRVPTPKLDNLVKGRVWIDDVQLVPLK